MAGKTEYIFLRGKVKFFRPNSLNKFGKWSHQIYLDQPSLELVRELQTQGVKNMIKKDDDGYFINVGRPPEIRIFTDVGPKSIALEPPKVLDGTRKTPTGDFEPFFGNVGDGSDVVTKVAVYPHKTPGGGTAKAMRWDSTRIDNLVPWKGNESFSDGEEKQVRGMEDQPPTLF